jgi:Homeodomain-like domain
MDDTPCQRFFREPDQLLHRRYAALRAFFIDGLSLSVIAEQFGATYHTVRSWVRDFRAACHAGQVPPFSPSHAWAGRPAKPTPGHRPRPSSRLPPMPAVSAWRRGGDCAPAWLVSSSFSPC